MSWNRRIGMWGEEQASQFLQRKGFVILDRNFYTTQGEIDIIAKKGDDIYFIEVKTRSDKSLANSDAITYFKKNKLEKAKAVYCYKKNIGGVGIVLAGLILKVDKINKTVKFNFFPFFDLN